MPILNIDAMTKNELRAACKEAGIVGYGKLNNDGMRKALKKAEKKIAKATAVPEDVDQNESPISAISEETREIVAEAANAGAAIAMANIKAEREFRKASEANMTSESDFAVIEPFPETELGIVASEVENKSLAVDPESIKVIDYDPPSAIVDNAGKTIAVVASGMVVQTFDASREERNGIKRPEPGTRFRAIWDALDKVKETGVRPTVATAKKIAVENGWSPGTAAVTFYDWQTFTW